MKIATKKQLLESIASLQAELRAEQELRNKQYNAMREAEQKRREAETKLSDAEWRANQNAALVRSLEIQLAEEDARAEAFEFVLRMQNKYPVVEAPPKSNKAMTDEALNHQRQMQILDLQLTQTGRR